MKTLAFLFVLILSASSFGLVPNSETINDEASIARDLLKRSSSIDAVLMMTKERFQKKLSETDAGSDWLEGKIQASIINMIEQNLKDVEATLLSADSEEELSYIDFDALEKKLEETDKLITEL